jgi:hypothetical protein
VGLEIVEIMFILLGLIILIEVGSII